MKTLLLLGLLCLSSLAFAAAPEPPELRLDTQGELVIGPDGRVRSWDVESNSLTPVVRDLVERNIREWRFEPILVDGQPVVAKTRMTLELLATRHPDGYEIKVADVFFGSLKASGKMKPPRYPKNAIRDGVGARVMLAVKLDRAGQVVAVHPFQTSLSKGGTDKQEARWRRMFEQASIAAAQQWKYEPGEVIGGRAVESSLVVPIEYRIARNGQGMRGTWSGYVPGPVNPAPWVSDESVAQLDTDRLGDGQAASLDSPFKLRSDVIGKDL